MLGAAIEKYLRASGADSAYLLVDVSGGIILPAIQKELDTLQQLAYMPKLNLRVITFDDRVVYVENFTQDNVGTSFPLHGGGGTKLSPALDLVLQQHSQPSKAMVFVYSDMIFPDDVTEYESKCDFIWIVDRHNARNLRAELKGPHVVL